MSASAEVDQLELERVEIDENVLVLDVAMKHAVAFHLEHSGADLGEEELGERLAERPARVDEVPQVETPFGSFHDDQVAVVTFDVVDDANASGALAHTIHQVDLHGYVNIVTIQCPRVDVLFLNYLYGYGHLIGLAHALVHIAESAAPYLVAHLVERMTLHSRQGCVLLLLCWLWYCRLLLGDDFSRQ